MTYLLGRIRTGLVSTAVEFMSQLVWENFTPDCNKFTQ